MATIKNVKTIFHNDEQYDLVMVEKNHEDYLDSENRRIYHQGWTVLASIKKDKRIFNRVKSVINKYLTSLRISAIVSVVCAALFAFSKIQLHNIGMFNLGYAIIIAVSVIIGLAAVGLSIFSLVKWLTAKSNGLMSGYGAYIEDNMSKYGGYGAVKQSEYHNQYSLITPKYFSNSTYKYSFNDIQRYVNQLSEEELIYFMTKSYEYGACNDSINEAEDLLIKNKHASEFLRKETENTLKELKKEFDVLSAIQVKENQKFVQFMEDYESRPRQKEETEDVISWLHKPFSKNKNDADEELLEFLSENNNNKNSKRTV